MATKARLTRLTSRGSDFEQAYASPIAIRAKKSLPRGFNDEAGKLGHDGRKRRSRGSSDDEGRIAEDGFSNEDLRVGGPYLCSIPVTSIVATKAHPLYDILERETSTGTELGMHILGMLRAREVRLDSAERVETVCFYLRQSRNNPEAQPVPTIVILATRHTVDDAWLDAARQIYYLLCHNNLAQVSVEIQDPEAERPPRTFPVPAHEPIFDKWNSVLAAILKDIEKKDLVLIGCYRRGRNPNPKENPPTVLVIVDVKGKRNWKSTRDSIVGILMRFNLPTVAVEICKDKLHTAAFGRDNGFDEDILDKEAMLGGPISNANYKNGSGTLGGFIELQEATTGRWSPSTFALTCYHVVYEGAGAAATRNLAVVEEWSKNGIPMQRSNSDDRMVKKYMTISHPSLLAKENQIASYREAINTTETNRQYQEMLDMWKNDLLGSFRQSRQDNFKDSQESIKTNKVMIRKTEKFFGTEENHLGFVVAASGFRQKKLHSLGEKRYPTILDWALIFVKRDWKFSNKVDEQTTLLKIADAEQLSDLQQGSEVHFKGYRSGFQTALYNCLQVARIKEQTVDGNREEQFTLEYTLTGLHQQREFVKRGDSGALVFTAERKTSKREGTVVGMVFAGLESNTIGRFTRIDDLTADVMAHTNAKDIRMHLGPGMLT